MSKRILYLSDYELRAFRAKGKTVTEVHRFQILDNGEAEFAQYLSSDSKTPIYWLIDTTQEGYQTALLPHVVGKDHRDLMSHKKKRLFDKTAYTYGVVQGHEKQGRANDRVLFTALNNPALLQPWLNLIIAHKVPLVGIYSLPLLTECLLKCLPKAPEMLLVAHTPPTNSSSPAGLRQSFFVNQKLQFSRLIPLNTLNPQPDYAEYVLKQIITLQHYLENTHKLSQTESHEPLLVVILTDTPLVTALNKHLDYDSANLNIQVLDNRQLAHQTGLQLERENQGPKGENPLYLHDFIVFQLSRRWYTTKHYATATDTRYFFYRRARQALYLTSALLLSGATITSLMTLEKAQVIQQSGKEWAEKETNRQAELTQLHKQGQPNLPIDILFIQNVVDVGRHLKAHHISPRSAWEKLSQILNDHPDVFIERLEWGIGHSAADIFQPYSKSVQTNNEDKAENGKNPLEAFVPTQQFIEGMRLHGKISSFKGNYKNALHTFRQFVTDLRQQHNSWIVEVLRTPYNPNRVLKGQIGSQAEEVSRAPFAINILIRHTYPHESS
ncbi:MAG TPA: hypothetical protein ENG03_09005 [Thioploca sp.]|nr:MAG: hypothetical protein DRR19_18255 [Gammaproteobacteria bacterium]HDN27215.1 hypothetical protein [Thioploca sp.]